jgi:hypothetical protein
MMDGTEIKTYRKEKGPETVEIKTYSVKGGYSFGVYVFVKWQGFGVRCPGHCGGRVINNNYIYRTESEALRGAAKYIINAIERDHNYTPENKAVIEKLLPDTEPDLFEGVEE